jgi:hypothetical protein
MALDPRYPSGDGYDAPDYLVTRERWYSGVYSCSTNASTYSGPSLRTFTKALIIGATVRIGSGGSAAGSNSLSVVKVWPGGTISVAGTHVHAVEAGVSALNDIVEIPASTNLTLESMGDCIMIKGEAASIDKVAVLSDVIFRYKLLPTGAPVENG